MIEKQYKNLILLGAPGSGKGTLSEQLVNELKYNHYSTGDLFRATMKLDTPLAKQIKEVIASGKLMPDSITNEMIASYITNDIKNNNHFVLDGYPRTVDQADYLNKLTDIDLAIYLDIEETLAIKRIAGRRVCPNCGKVYNIYFANSQKDGICDVCNASLIQRKDDNEQTAKVRFDVYNKQTSVLIDYYKNKGKLLTVKVDENTKDLLNLIKDQLVK